MKNLKIYDICKFILVDAHNCTEPPKIKKYRKALLYLVLVTNRYLPGYAVQLLLSLGQADYSIQSANAYIKRLMDKKILSSTPLAYHKMYALYSLTSIGVSDLISLLNNLTPVLNSNSELELLLPKLYRSCRKTTNTPHAIAESVSYTLLLLSLPLPDVLTLEREVQYHMPTGTSLNKQKVKGNLVSDLYFKYHSGVERNVFYEVDLSTERMSGENGLRQKITAYSALSSSLLHTTYFSSLQLIFSIYDDGRIPHCPTSSNEFTIKEINALKGSLHPYYFNISLAELALTLHESTPGKQHSLNDMLSLLKQHRQLLNKNVYRDEGKQYDTLLTLLETTARVIPPHGEIPVSRIRTALDQAAALAVPNKETAALEHYKTIYKKRRCSIFRMVCSEFPFDRPSSSVIGNALSQGMLLACCPGRYPQLSIPYLLPELFFLEQLPSILHNIGLSGEISIPINKVYCLPLRGTEEKDAFGTLHNNYSVYMRCTFMFGKTTCCIENISDDIGGFIRAKEYLKLPPNFRPNTFLILLVNDDGILADGSHIDECTLYHQEYLISDSRNASIDSRHYIRYETLTIVQLLQHYVTSYYAENKFTPAQWFFPFLSDSQDMVMLTYSEFQTAVDKHVSPWVKLPDYNGTITLKRGPLPYGHVPPSDVTAQSMIDQQPPCIWNPILATD